MFQNVLFTKVFAFPNVFPTMCFVSGGGILPAFRCSQNVDIGISNNWAKSLALIFAFGDACLIHSDIV